MGTNGNDNLSSHAQSGFEERPLEYPRSQITLPEHAWWEDEWFALANINPYVLAIAEPLYHQRNCSYLINGRNTTLLFDTGCGRRDIAPVVERHSSSPIAALPSHMHYDHLGGIRRFGPAWLTDVPETRACAEGSKVIPSENLFLGSWENLQAPVFEVARWIKPGDTIDLGDVSLNVIHTPGHSPDSISLHWPDAEIVFAADFLCPTALFAQIPGANLAAYLRSAEQLVAELSSATRILCGHGRPNEQGLYVTPELAITDLTCLIDRLSLLRDALLSGTAPTDGEWDVNHQMSLIYNAASARSWIGS